jgi:hypothetical protein
MNKGLCLSLGLGALFLLIPALAFCWNFDFEILSQPGGILNSDPVYDGVLTSGGDGTLHIELNDTYPEPWPTNPDERFDSLWAWFFEANYDGTPSAAKWVGQIPGTFHLEASNAPVGYNGWCDGSINAKITVRDYNENQILEPYERSRQHLFDGRLSKLCTHSAGGEMAYKWGWGALASNYFSFAAFPEDTLYDGGNLTLMTGCTTVAAPSSWSSIKALYR